MSRAVAETLTKWDVLRRQAYTWSRELPAARKVAMALGMAAVTGLAAQVRFPVPGTDVPVTGQVFAVLLAGILLGRGYGSLSQIFYVLLGAAGIPWFAGMTAGAAILAGPTGGYILGFILAAELIGYATDRWTVARQGLPQIGLMLAGVAAIYTCGMVHRMVFLGLPPGMAFLTSVAPFVAVDVGKALLAAGLSTVLLPKGEV